jgi:hypothetical protein
LTVDEVEDPPAVPCQRWFRMDGSHSETDGNETTVAEDEFDRNRGSDSRGNAIVAEVPWAVLSMGLAIFVCGAVLMIWSIVTQRQELWNAAIPLLLAGQAGLLVGLVLQLDRLRHENRRTAATVDRLDRQVLKSRASRIDPEEQGCDAKVAADPRSQLDVPAEEISR